MWNGAERAEARVVHEHVDRCGRARFDRGELRRRRSGRPASTSACAPSRPRSPWRALRAAPASRATSTRSWPRSASWRANCSPMPTDAPVTRATGLLMVPRSAHAVQTCDFDRDVGDELALHDDALRGAVLRVARDQRHRRRRASGSVTQTSVGCTICVPVTAYTQSLSGHVEDDLVAGREQVEVQERMRVRDPVTGEHGVAALARHRRSGPVPGPVVDHGERDAFEDRVHEPDLRDLDRADLDDRRRRVRVGGRRHRAAASLRRRGGRGRRRSCVRRARGGRRSSSARSSGESSAR